MEINSFLWVTYGKPSIVAVKHSFKLPQFSHFLAFVVEVRKQTTTYGMLHRVKLFPIQSHIFLAANGTY
ncbi:MAG: hypothetical protein COB84_10590, partial [Rhodobacteraceae bacterium]